MYFRPPNRSSALKRSGTALALALLAAHPGVAQPAPEAGSEVERFERALDEAVAGLGQPRVLPLLGGAPGARGFLVPGVGAVFVLPPQALPAPGRALVLRRGVRPPTAVAEAEGGAAVEQARLGAEIERHADQARAARAAVRQRAEEESDLERELREVEELALAYQREVERMTEQSERALLQLTEALRHGQREIRIPLDPASAPAEAPAPPAPPETPASPDTPAPPAPLPPWRYWFEMRAGGDASATRSVEDLVGSVRAAIVDAIEGHGPQLRTLGPGELVVVAVDFQPTALNVGDPTARPRRLVLTARQRDLQERRAGRLSSAQLRQRIEASEY